MSGQGGTATPELDVGGLPLRDPPVAPVAAISHTKQHGQHYASAKAEAAWDFRDSEGGKALMPTPKKLFAHKAGSSDEKDKEKAEGAPWEPQPSPTPLPVKKVLKSVGKDKTAAYPPHHPHVDTFSGFLDSLLTTTVSKAIEQSTAKGSCLVAPQGSKGHAHMHSATLCSLTHDALMEHTLYTDVPCEAPGPTWKFKSSLLPLYPSLGASPFSPLPTQTSKGLFYHDPVLDPASADPGSLLPSKLLPHKFQGPAVTSTTPASLSPPVVQPPPTPPPYPPAARPTYKQRRSPLFEFQHIVKRMALAPPGAPPPTAATRDMFSEMLNKACSYRHIAPRTPPGGGGAVRPPPEPEAGGDLGRVLAWMGEGGDGRHERTTAVLRCCLEFLILQLGGGGEGVGAGEVAASCLLPLLEENLQVGIEDMESDVGLFRHTITLIHELARLEDAPLALGALGPGWRPVQRQSVLQLCEEVDTLVAEYHAGLGVGNADEGHARTEDEVFFDMVRHVVGRVREACKHAPQQPHYEEDAPAPPPEREVSAWRCAPSVVSWFPGGVGGVGEAELDRGYEDAMEGHKLEGLEGVRDSHYFKGHSATRAMPARMARKLMQELVAMRRDLPLCRREGVLLRYDEERADYIKVLVLGSEGTPYAAGCFEYHIHCPPAYPDVPPSVWLITTGRGRVRFNPNLYEDGLVCSSLLNQGSGWGYVTWRTGESNLLEVCKSIMWVHMNADVYFAEPDQEDLVGTPEGESANEAYCDIVRYGNVKYAMLAQLQRPSAGFEDAIRDHFRLRKAEILALVEGWLADARKGCVGGVRRTRMHFGLSDEEEDEEDDAGYAQQLKGDLSSQEGEDCCDDEGDEGEDQDEDEDEEDDEGGVGEADAPEENEGVPKLEDTRQEGLGPCDWPEGIFEAGGDGCGEECALPYGPSSPPKAANLQVQPAAALTSGCAEMEDDGSDGEDDDDDDDGLPIGNRDPMPNYRAEFVQSHNPDLADRFDMGFYATDLARVIADLRAELAKL